MDIRIAGAVIVILGLVIVFQAVIFYLDRMRYIKQNAELMDRLMSVDFQSYAAGKRIQQQGDPQWKKKQSDQDDSPEPDGIGLSVT